MESAKNMILSSINKKNNIFINNSIHIIIDNEMNSINYDSPMDTNTIIFNNNMEIKQIRKNTCHIAIEPIYIKYIVSRENLDAYVKSNSTENTMFYNNIQYLIEKYTRYEQSLLLYNDSKICNIEPIISNIENKFLIDQSQLNHDNLCAKLLEMKQSMATYLQNSVWIFSPNIYQILRTTSIAFCYHQNIETFYGLPIYICTELKHNDLALLINAKNAYTILTKPTYNLVNIDNNTLKYNDGYEIDITLYLGSKIIDKKAMCILNLN